MNTIWGLVDILDEGVVGVYEPDNESMNPALGLIFTVLT